LKKTCSGAGSPASKSPGTVFGTKAVVTFVQAGGKRPRTEHPGLYSQICGTVLHRPGSYQGGHTINITKNGPVHLSPAHGSLGAACMSSKWKYGIQFLLNSHAMPMPVVPIPFKLIFGNKYQI